MAAQGAASSALSGVKASGQLKTKNLSAMHCPAFMPWRRSRRLEEGNERLYGVLQRICTNVLFIVHLCLASMQRARSQQRRAAKAVALPWRGPPGAACEPSPPASCRSLVGSAQVLWRQRSADTQKHTRSVPLKHALLGLFPALQLPFVEACHKLPARTRARRPGSQLKQALHRAEKPNWPETTHLWAAGSNSTSTPFRFCLRLSTWWALATESPGTSSEKDRALPSQKAPPHERFIMGCQLCAAYIKLESVCTGGQAGLGGGGMVPELSIKSTVLSRRVSPKQLSRRVSPNIRTYT